MSETVPSPDPFSDRQAVDGLARERRSVLQRYFRRKGFGPPDDEDAVQEVLTRLASRIGFASEVGQFDSYMFAVAANVATDLRRKDKARAASKHDVYDDDFHALADHDPEELLQGRQALEAVVTALKELPERTRTIFILARLEHMKQTEIASRLGIALNTVEKHLHKATAYVGERVGRRT